MVFSIILRLQAVCNGYWSENPSSIMQHDSPCNWRMILGKIYKFVAKPACPVWVDVSYVSFCLLGDSSFDSWQHCVWARGPKGQPSRKNGGQKCRWADLHRNEHRLNFRLPSNLGTTAGNWRTTVRTSLTLRILRLPLRTCFPTDLRTRLAPNNNATMGGNQVKYHGEELHTGETASSAHAGL